MYIMKILNKKMFHASLCLFLVTVGVYGGKICVELVGGYECPGRIESGEGAGTFCSIHTIPLQVCVNGDKQCVVINDPTQTVRVRVEHGQCGTSTLGEGLNCQDLHFIKYYDYPQGCYTVE